MIVLKLRYEFSIKQPTRTGIYKKINFDRLLNVLSNTERNSVITTALSVTVAFRSLLDTFGAAFDLCVEDITTNNSKLQTKLTPWITDQLCRKVTLRRKLYSLMRVRPYDLKL